MMENGRGLLEMVCKAYVSPDPEEPDDIDAENDNFDFGENTTCRNLQL
jgi:hypothetical protein